MATERRLRETAARCAGSIIRHREGSGQDARAAMRDDVRSAVAWLSEMGLSRDALDEWVAAPVRLELLGRYGEAEAGDLAGELDEALDALRWHDMEGAMPRG